MFLSILCEFNCFLLHCIVMYCIVWAPLVLTQLLLFTRSVYSKLPFRLSCNFKYYDFSLGASQIRDLFEMVRFDWIGCLISYSRECVRASQLKFGWNCRHTMFQRLYLRRKYALDTWIFTFISCKLNQFFLLTNACCTRGNWVCSSDMSGCTHITNKMTTQQHAELKAIIFMKLLSTTLSCILFISSRFMKNNRKFSVLNSDSSIFQKRWVAIFSIPSVNTK